MTTTDTDIDTDIDIDIDIDTVTDTDTVTVTVTTDETVEVHLEYRAGSVTAFFPPMATCAAVEEAHHKLEALYSLQSPEIAGPTGGGRWAYWARYRE